MLVTVMWRVTLSLEQSYENPFRLHHHKTSTANPLTCSPPCVPPITPDLAHLWASRLAGIGDRMKGTATSVLPSDHLRTDDGQAVKMPFTPMSLMSIEVGR